MWDLEAVDAQARRLRTLRMKVQLIQRKPARIHFSVEGYFSRVMDAFAHLQLDADLKVVPCVSTGLVPRLKIALFTRQHQGDVTHITGDIQFAALVVRPETTVVTVLDCGRLHQLSGIKRELLRQLWFRLPLKRLGAITTISEETKQDLLRWVPDLDPSIIHVVPVSVSPLFKRQPKVFNREKPRILQVGTTDNKNIPRLAKALSGISCFLAIVGRVSDDLDAILRHHGIDYESMSGISDEELVEQYAEADIIAFASTLEGFGMPIVEGQLVGRPVVTGNRTSMPEVAGDAAVLVDPFSDASIREGFLRVINDHEFRDGLIERGYDNAKRFDTESIAKQYIEIYKMIGQNSQW